MKTIISIILSVAFFAAGNTLKAQSAIDTLKTATIKVNGIGCNGDMTIIKKKLVNQEGVDDVTYTDPKSGVVTFTVKYHTSAISEKQIRTTIETAPCCDNPNDFPYKVQKFNSKTAKK